MNIYLPKCIYCRVAHFLVFEFPAGKQEKWSISCTGKTGKPGKMIFRYFPLLNPLLKRFCTYRKSFPLIFDIENVMYKHVPNFTWKFLSRNHKLSRVLSLRRYLFLSKSHLSKLGPLSCTTTWGNILQNHKDTFKIFRFSLLVSNTVKSELVAALKY